MARHEASPIDPFEDEEGNLLGYVTEDGEFIDLSEMPEGEPVLGFIARRRHDAHQQIKRWEQIRAGYDAVLLAKQDEPKATYHSCTIGIISGTYPVLDGEQFAHLILERYEHAFSAKAGADTLAVASVLAAIKTLDRWRLPEAAQALADKATSRKPRKAYVTSATTARPAPPRQDAP